MTKLSVCKDFNGKPIHDGDAVELSHGRRGTVQHNITVEDPDLRWTIKLGSVFQIPLNRESVASEVVIVVPSDMNTQTNDLDAESNFLREHAKNLLECQDRLFAHFVQTTEMGYGRIMQLAQKHWRESLIKRGHPPGGEFAYGPCVSATVPCGCTASCDWCKGSGWLTEKVKTIKDQQV